MQGPCRHILNLQYITRIMRSIFAWLLVGGGGKEESSLALELKEKDAVQEQAAVSKGVAHALHAPCPPASKGPEDLIWNLSPQSDTTLVISPKAF